MNKSETFNHKAVVTADEDFLAELNEYMGRSSDGIEREVPLFHKVDGTIDREKTLALPCYANFVSKA